MQEILLFSITSRLALGPILSPIQWVPVVKQQGFEADHSPPFNAMVGNGIELSYTYTSPCVFMARCLIKPRDNFSITALPIHYRQSVYSSYIDATLKNVEFFQNDM